ncbi:hypothetical protein GYMLUDRAFT_181123, partial [Collybiopsis luxurians FD-317 M1]
IWLAVRSPNLHRRVKEFLFKLMHGAQWIGNQWKHINGYESRAMCQHCNELENMEHILISCQRPHQSPIWELASSIWPKEYGPWPDISLGTIPGCSLLQFHDEKHNVLPEAQRLFTILVTEAAHLIWKSHCEIVIDCNGKNISVTEAYNRFKSAINEQLQCDICQTNQFRWKHCAISKSLVKLTWDPVIKLSPDLPNDWVGKSEVLVGFEPLTSFIADPHPP